jgi:hypothetical protein
MTREAVIDKVCGAVAYYSDEMESRDPTAQRSIWSLDVSDSDVQVIVCASCGRSLGRVIMYLGSPTPRSQAQERALDVMAENMRALGLEY